MPRSPKFYREIFLVSLASLLLEISYTRVFSFKLFYYFTYLIIGISLLGIGSGGVLVAIFPRLRNAPLGRLIPWCSLLAGSTVLLGYLVIAWIQLNAFQLADHWSEIAKLTMLCTALFAPFLMTGIVIAALFGARSAQVSRLYFADLAGAALACAAAVPLMYLLSPPGCIFLGGLIFLAAGLPLAWGNDAGSLKLGIPVAAVLLVVVVAPGLSPDPVPDQMKNMSPQRDGSRGVLFSRWSPIFRIDVQAPPSSTDYYIINHDGLMGSAMHRFSGDLATQVAFERSNRAYPFKLLHEKPRILIVGAAGGHEILASLYFGAGHITAVELNPVTVSLVRTHFADYVGHIADDPRVDLVNAEGRSFLERDRTKYDLIWFVAPDSYAAMNAATAGAFVLSESYLYTVEMIQQSLMHLTADGIICMQYGELDYAGKPNRTARWIATAREAFKRAGLHDFEQHILVSTSPEVIQLSTVLLSKSPFSPEQIHRFVETTKELSGGRVRYARGDAYDKGAVSDIITLPDGELAQWFSRYRYRVTAITDDSPFFWNFTRFRDVLGYSPKFIVDPLDAQGERLLLVLLRFTVAYAAVFLLLPFVAIRRTWTEIPYKGYAGVYFAALGLGFMFFEVSLIQKLTLFLGYPTYSLTVTLFALLISTGVGSFLSERYLSHRNRALLILLGSLLALMLFYQFGMDPIVHRLFGAGLAGRIGVAIGFLVPLGLCLGAFMPLGLRTIATVSAYAKEFVAWGWAVNGFFSVISSVLATILSMAFGFRIVLLGAVVIYAVGVWALLQIPATSIDTEHRPATDACKPPS